MNHFERPPGPDQTMMFKPPQGFDNTMLRLTVALALLFLFCSPNVGAACGYYRMTTVQIETAQASLQEDNHQRRPPRKVKLSGTVRSQDSETFTVLDSNHHDSCAFDKDLNRASIIIRENSDQMSA